ncbi:hypothetical protein GOV14_00635 [Candidatus Pacearchaeota archaeon]|nr:hypothetical protein [Candidatus Pacearchaeota archaeon]
MHLKRNKIGNFWAVPRKGTKYLAVPSHNAKKSMPLVVILRDILGLVKNKKELQRILNEKQIQINHKEIRNTNYPVGLFDVINIKKIKKNYRATLSHGKKMIFEEIKDKESETKIFKVLNKTLIPGKKIQVNLNSGKNLLTKEKVKTGDSVLLNLKDSKILKVIQIKKGAKVFVFEGKHAGISGKVDDILERGGKQIVKITADHKKVNVWIKNILAIE